MSFSSCSDMRVRPRRGDGLCRRRRSGVGSAVDRRAGLGGRWRQSSAAALGARMSGSSGVGFRGDVEGLVGHGSGLWACQARLRVARRSRFGRAEAVGGLACGLGCSGRSRRTAVSGGRRGRRGGSAPLAAATSLQARSAKPRAGGRVKRNPCRPPQGGFSAPNLVVTASTMTIAARNGSSLVMRQNRAVRVLRPGGEALARRGQDTCASRSGRRRRRAWSASRARRGSSPGPAEAVGRVEPDQRQAEHPGDDHGRVHDDAQSLRFHAPGRSRPSPRRASARV